VIQPDAGGACDETCDDRSNGDPGVGCQKGPYCHVVPASYAETESDGVLILRGTSSGPFGVGVSFLAKRPTASKAAKNTGKTTPQVPGVPSSALDVLREIDRRGSAPAGYRGGDVWENRGTPLTPTDVAGNPITYQEFDVHPYSPVVNRGAERIVVGSDGSVYYTDDHYTSFIRIR
jgi:guanyl-specific ribonuclease Sa